MDILQLAGAHFQHDDVEVAREVCLAVKENDLDRLRLWKDSVQDMSLTDLDGRSPLHVVCLSHFRVSLQYSLERQVIFWGTVGVFYR